MSKHRPDEDRRLMRRVAAGERSALEEVHARFSGELFRYVLTLSRNRQTAEEILQDTLVAVWRGAGTFEGRSGVKAWIFGVARRQVHNTLRRPKHAWAGEEDLDMHPSADHGPEEVLLDGVRREELAALVGQLSPVHHEALALFFFHELSYEEIAKVLEVPAGTVKSRLSNAKRALRTMVEASEVRER